MISVISRKPNWVMCIYDKAVDDYIYFEVPYDPKLFASIIYKTQNAGEVIICDPDEYPVLVIKKGKIKESHHKYINKQVKEYLEKLYSNSLDPLPIKGEKWSREYDKYNDWEKVKKVINQDFNVNL